MKTALINAISVGSRGFLGALARYGLSGLVHRQLPLTSFPYEIVDTEERIASFLPLIDAAVGKGLATVERVEIRFYRSEKAE